MRLNFHRGHLKHHVPLKEWVGTVEPSLRSKDSHPFELVSDDRIYELSANPELEKLFKRHTWERFFIKGILGPDNIIYVKAARLESDDNFELEDFTKPFDFMILKDQISHGFPITPWLDEIA